MEKKMKFKGFVCLIVLVFGATVNGSVADFDDLSLSPNSYWNGSDGSGRFTSGSAYFYNNYTDWGGSAYSWDGWSYSNMTDTTTLDSSNQYSTITGRGYNSANYGVSYVSMDWMGGYDPIPTKMTFTDSVDGYNVSGAWFTNTTYSYWAMKDGTGFSKAFGGASGDDTDWFLLTIIGKNGSGLVTGTVDFYLADYRFVDNDLDYIVNTWQYVDLSNLGKVKSLGFSLSSSDTGACGMNNPAYFAMDNLVPEPVTIALISFGGILLRMRKKS
jgi:hypothetical protein